MQAMLPFAAIRQKKIGHYPFVKISLAPAASAGSICTAPETGERVNRIP